MYLRGNAHGNDAATGNAADGDVDQHGVFGVFLQLHAVVAAEQVPV